MKSTSKKRTPSIVNLTVKRRYLTKRFDRLMDCARKHGRYGHRDATMILVAYRHGLRASEVCDLQWQQIELSEGRLHVHRVKNGIPSVHPIRGDEMRALRKLRRDYPTDAYVFVSERGGPIGPIGFHRLIQRLGEAAKMPFHPPAHASPCLWVQARQRWPRHADPAALPRPQEHSAHGQVHRNGARPLQGFLEGLTMAGPRTTLPSNELIHRAAQRPRRRARPAK
jgi:type 1 fimbriae regulatory protein FimB/type 1 fimbriae regulatory protein FimE